MIDTLFPRYYDVRYAVQFEELYSAWYEEKCRGEEWQWKAENTRFEHDPMWRYNFFSLTCVREGNHWFWKAAKILWAGLGGAV